MKASVQYNDFLGTTAADRSDLFVEDSGKMIQTICEWFKIDFDGYDYQFVGISVNAIKVDDAYVTLYFKNNTTKQIVKVERYSVHLQLVLNLFKRFEFQVGSHLEDVDDGNIEEVANEE